MADENPFEDKEIQGQPCGGEPARSTTPEEEVNENKGEKPSPIRAVSNWLSRGSR